MLDISLVVGCQKKSLWNIQFVGWPLLTCWILFELVETENKPIGLDANRNALE